MAENVKCKNCNRLKNHWCKAVLDSPDEDMKRDCRHFLQKTNGDRIREMTDEQLADRLIFWNDDWGRWETDAGCFDGDPMEFEVALRAELEWLKQPVEEE